MSSKKPGLPKLDPKNFDHGAFAAAAVPVPDPVQTATRPAEPKREAPKPVKGKAAQAQPAGASAQPPSRVGKKQLGVWVSEQKRKDLKRVALDTGSSVDEIVNDLIDDFLRRKAR
jgi:hypothetical protein